MKRERRKVLITDLLISDEAHVSLHAEHAVLDPLGIEIVVASSSDEEDIIAAGRGAIGILVTYARITRRILEALPELEVVVKIGIGYDNIDVEAAAELGVFTANVPDYGDEEVATHALSLILDAVRAVSATSTNSRRGHWVADLPSLGLRRPSSLTIGTLGMGRIARQLHKYLKPITSRLSYFDPFVESYGDARRCSTAEELFASCDIVSLHLPLTPETQGVVSGKLLDQARPGIVLVNTARAGLVDRATILAALQSRRVRYFGTDVFWEEPFDVSQPETSALIHRDDVVITPHVAWYSVESDVELRTKAAAEVARVLQGGGPRHPVGPSRTRRSKEPQGAR